MPALPAVKVADAIIGAVQSGEAEVRVSAQP